MSGLAWVAWLVAWIIALTFAASMLASWVLGRWWRRRRTASATGEASARFTDASMALLGLLLAFTFSMSLNRYDERRDAAIAESNAIGDLYTCASLLPAPAGPQLQALLADYTKRRLEGRRQRALRNEPERVMREARAMHAQAKAVIAAVIEQGSPIATPLVNNLNQMTSSHAEYLAAYGERLPGVVLVLLLLGSVIPAFLMGQHQSTSGSVRLSGPCGFGLLVTLVIYVTFDLNQPSGGLITVGEQTLVHLLQSMST